MEWYFDRLDRRWRRLPLRKQRLYTLAFFAIYLILTVVVLSSVVYNTLRIEKRVSIEYRRAPISIQIKAIEKAADSSSTILKDMRNER